MYELLTTVGLIVAIYENNKYTEKYTKMLPNSETYAAVRAYTAK